MIQKVINFCSGCKLKHNKLVNNICIYIGDDYFLFLADLSNFISPLKHFLIYRCVFLVFPINNTLSLMM